VLLLCLLQSSGPLTVVSFEHCVLRWSDRSLLPPSNVEYVGGIRATTVCADTTSTSCIVVRIVCPMSVPVFCTTLVIKHTLLFEGTWAHWKYVNLSCGSFDISRAIGNGFIILVDGTVLWRSELIMCARVQLLRKIGRCS